MVGFLGFSHMRYSRQAKTKTKCLGGVLAQARASWRVVATRDIEVTSQQSDTFVKVTGPEQKKKEANVADDGGTWLAAPHHLRASSSQRDWDLSLTSCNALSTACLLTSHIHTSHFREFMTLSVATASVQNSTVVSAAKRPDTTRSRSESAPKRFWSSCRKVAVFNDPFWFKILSSRAVEHSKAFAGMSLSRLLCDRPSFHGYSQKHLQNQTHACS